MLRVYFLIKIFFSFINKNVLMFSGVETLEKKIYIMKLVVGILKGFTINKNDL